MRVNDLYEESIGKGWFENWSREHFRVIERSCLTDKIEADVDEEVEMSFIALKGKGETGLPFYNLGNWAFVVTGNKLLFGQKHLIGESIKVLKLDSIRDIEYRGGIYFSIITIDSVTETVRIAIEKEKGRIIVKTLMKFMKR